MLLCAINISEGRDVDTLDRLADAAGTALIDRHADADHNRSVWTLAGPEVEEAARSLTRRAVELLDLRAHEGVHPRTGVVDVVPWVHLATSPGAEPRPADIGHLAPDAIGHLAPDAIGHLAPDAIGHLRPADIGHLRPADIGHLRPADIGHLGPADIGHLGPADIGHLGPADIGHLGPADIGAAVEARGRYAAWVAGELGVPAVLYGPSAPGPVPARTLPEVRRRLWVDLVPDVGGPGPHPSAGAVAVGARPALVAYNLWLTGGDLTLARSIASGLRGPAVRSLGLALATGQVQVSCNLIDPWSVGPGAVYDSVERGLADAPGCRISRTELVGLVPAGVLGAEAPERWAELDLSPSRTIEARLAQAGLEGGSWVRL